MTAGVGRGHEHLLAAPGYGAERLAGSKQPRARLDAVSDGVEDLLLLLRGRSTYDARAAEVEEVAVERSVQIEANHVAGFQAAKAVGRGSRRAKCVRPRARGEPQPV
jgi:hypothetical protein